jgi:hypothetical protein
LYMRWAALSRFRLLPDAQLIYRCHLSKRGFPRSEEARS